VLLLPPGLREEAGKARTATSVLALGALVLGSLVPA